VRIAVYHNLPAGGAHRILHGLCGYLTAKGHTVDVFTLETSDQQMFPDAEVASRVHVLPYRQRRQITMGLYLNDLRRRADLADLERVNRQVAALIDAGGYDAAFVEACRFTFAPAVLRYLTTPSAFYYNGSPGWLEGPSWRSPATPLARFRRLIGLPLELQLERRLRRADRDHVRLADMVVTNSHHSQGRVAEAYGVAAHLCPPGVSLVPGEAPEEQGYVLSVGSVESRKGFDFLVEALGFLPAAVRPPLVIAANAVDPPVLKRLYAQAPAAGVDLRVETDVRDPRLSALYRGALAFLYGSHTEPLGMAPLEAMAHRRPVIAVAEGGVVETVVDSETGYLVPRDPEAFAGALAGLLADAGLRRRMGEAGRQVVEQEWLWEVRGPGYEEHLQRLAAGEG